MKKPKLFSYEEVSKQCEDITRANFDMVLEDLRAFYDTASMQERMTELGGFVFDYFGREDAFDAEKLKLGKMIIEHFARA